MRKVMALASSLLLVSGVALGDQMAGSTPSFGDVDTDGNGSISHAEASSYDKLSMKFSEADTNSDGELSKTEFSAVQVRLNMDMQIPEPQQQ